MRALGAPELLIVAAIGSNRTTWLVMTIVLTFVCGIGGIVALVYLLSVRPKLQGR